MAAIRVLVCVVTLAAILVGPIGPRAAVSAPPPDAFEIADAVRFRTSLGFPSDRATIDAATLDPARFPDTNWGVRLTRAEAAEVSRRVDVQLSMGPPTDFASGLPGFAGVYIDQHDDGAPVFLFKNGHSTSEARSGLEARLPAGTRFVTREVKYSHAELGGIRSAIERSLDELLAAGIDVVGLGIENRSNRVTVGVATGFDKAVDAFAQYGDAVSVEPDRPAQSDACTIPSCWPPKGGFRVYSVAVDNNCTSGFMAKAGTVYALATAGHCTKVGLSGNWAHNNDANVIGTPRSHTWFEGSDADAVFIRLNVAPVPSSGRNLFVSEDNETHALTQIALLTQQPEGAVACRTGYGTGQKNNGAHTGKTCGTIVNDDVMRESCIQNETNCVTINHTWEVDFDSTGGDSGGPIHVGISTGMGTHVHSVVDGVTPARGWYSPLQWVQIETSQSTGTTWRFCLNSSCSVSGP
jgi:hypothetical protein